jgi:hypothetical protein
MTKRKKGYLEKNWRRMGIIELNMDILRQLNESDYNKLFKNIVIIKAENDFVSNSIIISAISKEFEIVPVCCRPNNYYPVIFGKSKLIRWELRPHGCTAKYLPNERSLESLFEEEE